MWSIEFMAGQCVYDTKIVPNWCRRWWWHFQVEFKRPMTFVSNKNVTKNHNSMRKKRHHCLTWQLNAPNKFYEWRYQSIFSAVCFFLVNRGVFGASCCLGENLQYFAVEYESSFAHTAMTLLPSKKKKWEIKLNYGKQANGEETKNEHK